MSENAGARVSSVRRHWLGGTGLGLAFWLISVLPLLLGALLLDALATWSHVRGSHAGTVAAALLLGWPAQIALQTWATVGTWRAADAYVQRGQPALWATSAKLVLCLLALASAAACAITFVPQLPVQLRALLGSGAAGPVPHSTSDDFTTLRLQGPLRAGSALQLATLADREPRIQLLELALAEATLDEAQAVAALVRQRTWRTRTLAPCVNACVVVFMAGSRRQVLPDAPLGLHRTRSGAFNPLFQAWANHSMSSAYAAAGLSAPAVLKIMSTPPTSLWQPAADELVDLGLITSNARPLDVDLPVAAQPEFDNFKLSLSANAVWLALDKRQAGSVAAAAARMLAAREQSMDAESQQAAAQDVVNALVTQILGSASAELQQDYLALLAEQLRAARALGPAACTAMGNGPGALRRVLPAALAKREATWLTHLAQEPPPTTAPRALAPIELEVLRRDIGEQAAAALPGLWRMASASAMLRDCERAAALIDRIQQLAPAQRRLALRAVFAR